MQRHTNGVAVLRIPVPARDALSTTTLAQLRSAAEDLTQEPTGAIVVWGGPEVFSSGGDPGEFPHLDDRVDLHQADRGCAAAPPPPPAPGDCGSRARPSVRSGAPTGPHGRQALQSGDGCPCAARQPLSETAAASTTADEERGS